MLNFIKRKYYALKLKQDAKELLKTVKSENDLSVGYLLTCTLLLRQSLNNSNLGVQMPEEYLAGETVYITREISTYTAFLGEVLKHFQNDDELNILVSAFPIWLLTFRTLIQKDLAPMTKDLWQELQRGLPYVKDYAEEIQGYDLTDEQVQSLIYYPPIFK